MGMQAYCTDSARRLRGIAGNAPILLLLTAAVLGIHGFHPWAEDGGLYASGIEYKLDPHLFAKDTAFVLEPTRYSIFASLLSWICRVTTLSVLHVLLLSYVGTCALMIWSVHQLATRMLVDVAAQWTATCLLTALWTLPIAGTSLYLMDPYMTARSFAVPLVVLALGQLLEVGAHSPGDLKGWIKVAAPLAVACSFHVLMGGYGAAFCTFVWIAQRRRLTWGWIPLTAALLIAAKLVQVHTRMTAPAATAAVLSRSYWFLSRWRWYELVGLAAPVLSFAMIARCRPTLYTAAGRQCCQAAVQAGCVAFVIALLFAREAGEHFGVARLQPLRIFVYLYIAFLPVMAATAVHLARYISTQVRVSLHGLMGLLLTTVASAMFLVQRSIYPCSPHLEVTDRSGNGWENAFSWIHANTPQNAVVALDAFYTAKPGEDAQNFRPLAERSMLADFSKDGGEASVEWQLAGPWQRDVEATHDLDQQEDAMRTAELRRLGATWMILAASTLTAQPCPYRASDVKVCKLQ